MIKSIHRSTISDTNRLIAALATYVRQKVGLKVNENRSKRNKEPFWKRRIRQKMNEIGKHINILERYKRNELRKNGKYNSLEHKYHIKKKGLNTVIEEPNQRLKAKAAKIRRYEIGVKIRLQVMQKTALLATARILRKVLSL